jgi:hypothetical protein
METSSVEPEKELAMRKLLERRKQEILSTIMTAIPEECGTFIPTGDQISALIELADLENQLETLRSDSPNGEDSGAFVGAPLRPLPPDRSGAIALPAPEYPIR